MKTTLYLIIATISFLNFNLYSQGCVAVRQMGGNVMCGGMSYNLPKGEFQIGANYRYFHSWRHFVGSDEKEFRQTTQGGFDANGKERGNAVNIYSHAADINASYGITDRLQLNVVVPYVHNERSQVLRVRTGEKIELDGRQVDQVLEGRRYSVYAKGLGDLRLTANYWVFNPSTTHKGNVMVGLGLKLNTGRYNVRGKALALDPKTKEVVTETQVMDQAIQPGDGGVGFSIELQGFRHLYRGIYGFANGSYLFNPKESNGAFKSAPKEGLEGYNIYACPDQYFGRAGVTKGFFHNSLNISLAGRLEGIPAYDVFGGQVAYRRPGYVVAVEGGASYRIGKHTFSLFIPYNFIRNRIQSAADIADQKLQNSKITDESKKVHVQGDAAFADYSINLSYTYRIGKLFK